MTIRAIMLFNISLIRIRHEGIKVSNIELNPTRSLSLDDAYQIKEYAKRQKGRLSNSNALYFIPNFMD